MITPNFGYFILLLFIFLSQKRTENIDSVEQSVHCFCVLVLLFARIYAVTCHNTRKTCDDTQCAKQDETKTEHHDAEIIQTKKKHTKVYVKTPPDQRIDKIGDTNVRELNAGRDSAKSCVIIKYTQSENIQPNEQQYFENTLCERRIFV